MSRPMRSEDMTEPVLVAVDPATLAKLHEFAAGVLPNYTQAMFPYIVGKILIDLTAAGLEWVPR